jgi:hypothetical protein
MNDDEVFDAMKKTLSDVQMDRPVESIEQRGRARRRNRGVVGLVAGGGLAAVAALALALPMASQQSSPAAPAEAGGTTGSTTAMTPAAFTLVKQSNNTVKLTLDYKKILDPGALQSALSDAGIPAVVKKGELCEPKGEQLPQADKVFQTEQINWPDGSAKQYDLVISPAKMPKNSVVYFSVFAIHPGGDYEKAGLFLVSKDAPMNCRTIA